MIESKVKPHPNYIAWRISYQCNFRCKACFFSPEALGSVHSTLNPTKLINFLEETDKRWRIGVSGGEAFYINHFIELAKTITKKHQLEINTNLSVKSKIHEFAQYIKAESVPKIIATFHPKDSEEEVRKKLFIENYNFLKGKGFNTEAVFVITPERVNDYYKYFEEFKRSGITLTPKPFRGLYNGSVYPFAFTHEERKVFSMVPRATRRIPLNYFGVNCKAGSTCVRVHNEGTITRCGELPYESYIINKKTHQDDTLPTAENTKIGDINNSPSDVLNDKAYPCAAKFCTCFGRHFTVLTPYQKEFVKGMRSFMENDYVSAKKHFGKVLELKNDHASAMNNLGASEFFLGNKDKASTLFKEANKIDMNKRSLFTKNVKNREPQLCPDVLT
ncbi:MAG: hypothetical protein ACPGJV_10685 [Bacteriovoracaceae bacterium]